MVSGYVSKLCIYSSAFYLYCVQQRLFFLNGDQELSSFLLVNMGIVKYPQYQCNRQTPVFPSREALLEYEKVILHLFYAETIC